MLPVPRLIDFVIIGTSRQRSKLTRFFPTPIPSHSITPSDTVRNIGAIFDGMIGIRTFNVDIRAAVFCLLHNLNVSIKIRRESL